jgi:ABC-type transport system involved in cytochrome bd biosynthesis fused ATPase/permease subunit
MEEDIRNTLKGLKVVLPIFLAVCAVLAIMVGLVFISIWAYFGVLLLVFLLVIAWAVGNDI